MEAFLELRQRAREKRDKIIAGARDEYASALVRIAALEQDLLGRDSSTHRSVASCINSVLPSDRPFSATDVMASLEALDPARVWRKRAIDSHISRLRERGVVRRLSKARGSEPASYARVGVQAEAGPFGDKPLVEVMAEVLGSQALTQTELAVAMIEAGYRSTMTAKGLRNAVGVKLRGERGLFSQRAGRWMLNIKVRSHDKPNGQ